MEKKNTAFRKWLVWLGLVSLGRVNWVTAPGPVWFGCGNERETMWREAGGWRDAATEARPQSATNHHLGTPALGLWRSLGAIGSNGDKWGVRRGQEWCEEASLPGDKNTLVIRCHMPHQLNTSTTTWPKHWSPVAWRPFVPPLVCLGNLQRPSAGVFAIKHLA